MKPVSPHTYNKRGGRTSVKTPHILHLLVIEQWVTLEVTEGQDL
jgi:hypothetical protein